MPRQHTAKRGHSRGFLKCSQEEEGLLSHSETLRKGSKSQLDPEGAGA